MKESTKPQIGINIADGEHTCSNCGGLIPKGHRYWYLGGKGSQHTNCSLYTEKYTKLKIMLGEEPWER